MSSASRNSMNKRQHSTLDKIDSIAIQTKNTSSLTYYPLSSILYIRPASIFRKDYEALDDWTAMVKALIEYALDKEYICEEDFLKVNALIHDVTGSMYPSRAIASLEACLDTFYNLDAKVGSIALIKLVNNLPICLFGDAATKILERLNNIL